MLQITCTTAGVRQTEELGASIGARLKGGEALELVGDVGGGKTAFVRGLAKGAGSSDHVSSPTFTVSKIYAAPRLAIHHFDFYRLGQPGIVARELAEAASDPKAVVVVEWAQTVRDVLRADRLVVAFQPHPTDTDQRSVTISGPDSLKYLIKDLPYSVTENT